MGCDIHMHVEYKHTNEKWVCGDYFSLDPDSTSKNPKYIFQDLYGGRNYRLFSILAGVRNYGDIKPIDNPRGLPEDASEFVKQCFEDWDINAHSCSYFTLRELIDFSETSYDWEMDYGALRTLIDKIKERADELYLIYLFTWDKDYDKAYGRSDMIRIVFWFDN